MLYKAFCEVKMSKIYEELEMAFTAIRDRIPFKPELAIVLGSGLGKFADRLEIAAQIPYRDIPGFPVSTVAGHAGTFLFGTLHGKRIVCMQGRVHYYEGYSMKQVVMPVRLMRMMGAEKLLLTNAAGGINRSFTPGDLMCITDHISDFVPSPLIGENVEELGTRFPDMSRVYDEELSGKLRDVAKENQIKLQEGIYIQLSGPNYETPAEIRMCGMLGADAVGMSTVVEAMAARHAGMRVCGISLITNMASGISAGTLSHTEVQETADAAAQRFEALLEGFVQRM
jgi:purine-nucleoside phosphorylase